MKLITHMRECGALNPVAGPQAFAAGYSSFDTEF